jgi:hypothetical protein
MTGDDLAQPGVVVGMRVRHQRGQERLPDSVGSSAHLLRGRDRQQPVDRDHARYGFDEVRVDERTLVLGGKSMNRRLG